MARTQMAHLPWMIRTLFSVPTKILPMAQTKQIFMDFFLFHHGIVCCVYALELPHRENRVENRKDFPKLSLFASWTGAMINPQWLDLPMSRTNFHGPKDIRAIEIRLYLLYAPEKKLLRQWSAIPPIGVMAVSLYFYIVHLIILI